MGGPKFQYVEAIVEHSAGFVEAAGRDLDAAVEHCPGWTVADLVDHLTEVHWFWGNIVAERLGSRPDDVRRPARAPHDQLLTTFATGADRLATILAAANPEDAVWTWAPTQQNVGFVIRHQVQEAAVHHWDAARATGANIEIAAEVAADAIEEFITVSVSTVDDPWEPARPALAGELVLRCTDADAAWTISDAAVPGTLQFRAGQFRAGADEQAPVISATASDLLLWLYDRVEVTTPAEAAEVTSRFQSLRFS